MVWMTPEMLYPGLEGTKLSMGLDSELVELPVAEDGGFIIEENNATLQISIPNDTEGAYRKVRSCKTSLFRENALADAKL